MLAEAGFVKQSVDKWLDQVDYSPEFEAGYVPSPFALAYVNFVKMVNGTQGEQHPSPVVHLRMLDKLAGPKKRLANLCSRGLAKTTLFFEYLCLYIAVFEGIEGFGEISGMIYVSDSMENGVKSARKNIEFRYHNSEFLQHWLPEATFTDNYIEFTNRNGHRLGIKMFGAKTGLRGTKIFGKRPTLGVLDDLVSDDDARSKTAMAAINDTVYKGIDYALDPVRRKIVFNGTPFNKGDVLYEAVESGGWDVNVWPICEKFPCTREEFRGAWPERFSYDFVSEQYEMSKATGKVSAFLQELMLRIASEEERVIQDSDMRWYSRRELLEHKHRFNFFMTTDFAVSEKQGADFNVQAIWALNNAGDWFLVDGWRKQCTMEKTVDNVFSMVSSYRPLNVGMEVTGQQAGFIAWFQREMLQRNVWFTFATHGNGDAPGIRPATDKLTRFNMTVPLFKMGKIFFPEEARTSEWMQAFLDEIRAVTQTKIKAKNDDCLDNISQLPLLNAWRPSEEVIMKRTGESERWAIDDDDAPLSGLSSYVV